MRPANLFLRIILALIPAFIAWWYIGSFWLNPAVGIADGILSVWLPDSFKQLQLVENSARAVTNWGELQGRLVPARSAGYAIAIDSNLRILSYSFPFYLALQAALWHWQPKLKIALALVLMYIVMSLSIAAVSAKTMMVGLGPAFSEPAKYWFVVPNMIALLYQLSTLILPLLLPAFLWVAINQQHLKGLFLDDLSGRDGQADNERRPT